MEDIAIRNLVIADYDRVIQLWSTSDGVHMHRDHSETLAGMEDFLNRNPGMSCIALDGDRIVGAVLGSHDGRRGFINHLAVSKPYRRRGIGCRLVQSVIHALKGAGMQKIAIFILKDNSAGHAFWKRMGFGEEAMVEVHSTIV